LHKHRLEYYLAFKIRLGVRVRVFNVTFSNSSDIQWQSVLLVEETGVSGKKTTDLRKSLTNFITKCCIEYTSPERDSKSQR
jgi:hypothetical protein